MKLAAAAAPALEVAYQGQRVLLVPPVARLAADALPGATGPLAALVIPGALAGPRDRKAIMDRLNPGWVVVYGDPGRTAVARSPWPVPCQFTRDGAVSLLPGRLRSKGPAMASGRVRAWPLPGFA